MKTTNEIQPKLTTPVTLANRCVGTCRKLIAQIRKTKVAIFTEFIETRETHQRLLLLALNEAEALAWQTGFPQLVFPTLAREKAEAVAAWEKHQRSINRMNSALSLRA